MKIVRLISGGQTGADRAGLDAAISCGLPYGGSVPLGRRSEDGKVPDKYEGMKESPYYNYLPRTEANVVDSDATIVFCYGAPVRGSKRTVTFAAKHRKPYLVINLNQPKDKVIQKVVEWLKTECPLAEGTLNVAGSREETFPGINKAVIDIMVEVIKMVNHEERSIWD